MNLACILDVFGMCVGHVLLLVSVILSIVGNVSVMIFGWDESGMGFG